MKEIMVYADWVELPSRLKMGLLRVDKIRGKEVFSFEYDTLWLKSGYAQELDPDLRLFSGPQFISDEKPNFGIFLDSSPDRWGRTLMERREAIWARRDARPKRNLFESDYLLGVHDETRMGGLRFRIEEDQPFLANDPDLKAPPFTSIRELEQASLKLEEDNFFQDKEALKWLNMLMAPGSSLGGARPKANVRDPEDQLWIAKFPSKSDDFNSGGWEFLLNQLAREVGIQVPEAMCQKYTQKQHTMLSKRFDRTQEDKRIHFSSAMTLLGYKDGYDHLEGGSYLELIDLLEKYGAAPLEDTRELWKRIVFSVMVSNTDDHLRNHGFLLTSRGWRLSPAYDMNPNPKGTGLSLNISDDDNSLNLGLCLEVAPLFRWKAGEANDFIQTAKKIIGSWEKKAESLSIPHAERTLMAPAFSLAILKN